ncbi:MAG: hypothetical protein PUG15_09635 [Bacteroidales bacterium]|nr:hypothetical protein [Bacteroidales bacterium]
MEYAQEFPPNYSGMEQLLSENLSINDYEQTTDGILLCFPPHSLSIVPTGETHMQLAASVIIPRESLLSVQNATLGSGSAGMEGICRISPDFFLEHGFDVSLCEGEFWFWSLIDAMRSSYDKYAIEVVRMLLQAGADPRCCNADESMVEYLLEAIEIQHEEGKEEDAAVLEEILVLIEEKMRSSPPGNGSHVYFRGENKATPPKVSNRDGTVSVCIRELQPTYAEYLRRYDAELLKKSQ